MAVTADMVPRIACRLVYADNPLLPAASRTILPVRVPSGTPLASVIHEYIPHIAADTAIVRVNDRILERDDWPWYPLCDGDVIHAVAALGNGGHSDVGRALLTIAVAVASIYAPGYFGVTSAFGAAATRAAVLIAGQYLVNRIIPPRLPDFSNKQADTGSPTYSIAGGRNRARAYEPMLLVYGDHNVVPDIGAKPYTEYEGEDQYLYQIFHFGVANSLGLSDFKIGETDLSKYDIDIGADVQISGYDGKLTLFPGNVDTIEGGTLTGDSTWVTRTTSTDTTEFGIDIVGSLYQIEKDGIGNLSCSIEAEYRVAGSADSWSPIWQTDVTVTRDHYWSFGYYPPFGNTEWVQLKYDDSTDSSKYTGAPHETFTVFRGRGSSIDVDAYWRWRPYSETENLWTRYGRAGPPTTATWNDATPPKTYRQRVNAKIITNGTSKPVRFTEKVRVPQGQYEVRVRRTTPDFTDDKKQAQFTFTQLKSYQPDTADYTGQKRVAIKIRATGQLNGAIDQFSAVAHAPVLVYDDANAAWVTKYTANAAWVFLAHARGQHDANGKRLYGAGLDDERIDIEAIKDWAAFCETNNLTCNIVFDSYQSVGEQLDTIAQCGRASKTWGTGKLGVVIDEPGAVVAAFGMTDIVAGSFKVSYMTRAVPDQIEGQYINAEIGWKPDVVRVNVPGVTSPERPTSVQLVGVTNPEQAAREVNLIAASQYYHRKRIEWQTDAAGLVVLRGDTVSLSHDLTRWDYSGRITAGDTTNITLSREIPFYGLDTAVWIMAIQPDGTQTYHDVQPQAVGQSDAIELLTPLPAAPTVDWRFFAGTSSTPGKKLKIIDVRPASMNRIRISAVEEVDEYYAAADGTFDVPGSVTGYRDALAGSIGFDEQVLTGDGVTRVYITWELVDADSARLRVRVNGGNYTEYPVTTARSQHIDVMQDDVIDVEVKPIQSNALLGPKGGVTATATHTVAGIGGAPPDVQDFAASRSGKTDRIRLSWTSVANDGYRWLKQYEIRKGANWGQAVKVATTTDTNYELITAQNGTFLIEAINTRLQGSTTAAAVIINTAADINVVVQGDEAPSWTGVGTNVNVSGGTLEQTDATAEARYEADDVDIGAVLTSRIELEWQPVGQSIGDTWDNWTDPWTRYGSGWTWAGPTDVVDADIEVATSDTDAPTPTTVPDSGPNSNAATLAGGTKFSLEALAPGLPGSIVFPNTASGDSATLNIGASAADLGMSSNRFTVECWYKPATFNYLVDIFRFGGYGAGIWTLSVASNGMVVVNITDSSSINHSALGGSLTLGEPARIAGVYDGTDVIAYINDTEVARTTVGAITLNTTATGSVGKPSGSLSELRVWNIARTPAELQATAGARLAGTETGLTGYWKGADQLGFTDWRPYTPGYATFRHLKVRATMRSLNGALYRAGLTELKHIIDVPDVVQTWEDEPIAAGGTTLSFTPPFTATPRVFVTIQGGAAGDTYKVTGKSTAGVTIQCFDTNGTAVARSCDVRAEGY